MANSREVLSIVPTQPMELYNYIKAGRHPAESNYIRVGGFGGVHVDIVLFPGQQ